MYISSSYITIAVILLSFYVCLEGYLLVRALGRVTGGGAGGSAGGKIRFRIYWPLSLLGAGLYFYFRYSSGALRSLFSMVSSYWGLFLFVPFFIAADILILGAFLFRRIFPRRRSARGTAAVSGVSSGVSGAASGAVYRLSVRLGVVVLALVTLVAGSVAARYTTFTSYSVTCEKPLPKKNLRIVLVSDLHIGSMVHKKELKRIVSGINALEGDIVLIAGDIIDRDMDAYKNENLNEEMSAIKAPLGVYAVPGNHDYFGGSPVELEKQLAAAGIRLLIDESVLVDNAFYVIGRNDLSVGRRGVRRKSLRELTGDLDTSLPLIVVDHQPVNLGEAEASGIDLQVSGHTHRGQIWPGPIFTKRAYEDDYGLLYKGKTAVVVTSGCGTWGPPLRIGTKSEIVCIELKNP